MQHDGSRIDGVSRNGFAPQAVVPPYEQLQAAVAAVRSRWSCRPKVAIVLGTGLGSLANQIEVEATVRYEDVPYLPVSTAESHVGQFVCGTLAGVPVAAMQGRMHGYEGYPLWQTTLAVRVLRELGAQVLVLSSAVGGLNPQYAGGDLMLVDDHINLMGDNPLIGINDDRLGPRFPDMSEAYDRTLAEAAWSLARREQIRLHRGVLVALRGPNLETRGEYRFLRRIGADVVGMSMPPETIVARHCGMRVLGFAVVTNVCLPDELDPVHIKEIVDTAGRAEPQLRRLLLNLLQEWSKAGCLESPSPSLVQPALAAALARL